MKRGVAGGAAADAADAKVNPRRAKRARRRRMAAGRSVGDGVSHAQLAAAGVLVQFLVTAAKPKKGGKDELEEEFDES